VTDYSSVCWDVFYLDKPVVFFQFDRDKYEEAHGSYLDMSKDLFGDCADNVDDLLDELSGCIRDDFKVKPEYEKMRQNFYKYVDDQNSRRICDAIVKKWS
jgi:CDP-glycerol glycerophosphotransferase (TagB/SpsB family)